MLMLVFTACPSDTGRDIWFVNNSNDKLFLYWSYNRDELFPSLKSNLHLINEKSDNINNSIQIPIYITESDSIYISIFSVDSVYKYSIEELKGKNMILKRFRLSTSEEELRKMNFKIEYP